jgi:hypothetical protein
MNYRYLISLAISLIFISCSSVGVTEQVSVKYDYFGDTIDITNTTKLSDLLFEMESGEDSVFSTFSAQITSICQKKGCWMELDLGNGENALVRFEDYGFFVPMNAVGELAILKGAMTIDTLSVDWLKHQASDAGKSDSLIASITDYEVSYSILASGVALERKDENKDSRILEE